MEWARSRRFWDTEKRIFDVYFELEYKDTNITPGIIAKLVGISRVTLYRHHFSVGRMRKDYEKMLIREYKKSIKQLQDHLPADQLLYRMLFFIVQYKKACRLLLADGNVNLMKKMINYIKPDIMVSYGFDEMPALSFAIYASEIHALVIDWGKRGFDEDEIVIVHQNIVYLTKTASKRLGALKTSEKISGSA